MAKFRKSKTNNKYFEDLRTSQTDLTEFTNKIMCLLNLKSNIKMRRKGLVTEKRNIHKRIYNMTLEIKDIEGKIEKLLKSYNTYKE